jgi:hypothetical protein
MKTRVKVALQAEQWVEIDVEHEEDEDPCDLTAEDQERASDEVDWITNDWEVVRVEVAS